jgi:hypothetical protein
LKNRFFDLNPEVHKQEKITEQWESKYLVSHFQKVGVLSESLNRLPTDGEYFFLQTDTAFNAFTFVTLVAKANSIKHLFASTYSISRRVVDSLIELHDKGVIEQITLLVSESMIKRNPLIIDNLMQQAKSRSNMTVLFAWIHAKVCLMQTGDAHYVVEGSGNWSENAHYEQYLFSNDAKHFEFRKELFTNINLKKY